MTNVIKFPGTFIPRLIEEPLPTLAWTPRIQAAVDALKSVANTDDVVHPFECKRTIDGETCCAKQCGTCANIEAINTAMDAGASYEEARAKAGPFSEDCTCMDYYTCSVCCWRDWGTDPSTLYDDDEMQLENIHTEN